MNSAVPIKFDAETRARLQDPASIDPFFRIIPERYQHPGYPVCRYCGQRHFEPISDFPNHCRVLRRHLDHSNQFVASCRLCQLARLDAEQWAADHIEASQSVILWCGECHAEVKGRFCEKCGTRYITYRHEPRPNKVAANRMLNDRTMKGKSMTNPHNLITKLERDGFYGNLKLQFRHGKITCIKKTETFALDSRGPNNFKEEIALRTNEPHNNR